MLFWVVNDHCVKLLLILVDVPHTSKGFKAEPYSICEAHSPGPEHKRKNDFLFHLALPVYLGGYQVVK